MQVNIVGGTAAHLTL